jgi:hypothetical protein
MSAMHKTYRDTEIAKVYTDKRLLTAHMYELVCSQETQETHALLQYIATGRLAAASDSGLYRIFWPLPCRPGPQPVPLGGCYCSVERWPPWPRMRRASVREYHLAEHIEARHGSRLNLNLVVDDGQHAAASVFCRCYVGCHSLFGRIYYVPRLACSPHPPAVGLDEVVLGHRRAVHDRTVGWHAPLAQFDESNLSTFSHEAPFT